MIYHVYANKSNIGDWLSARGIQSLLSPLKMTELFCDDPFFKGTLERLSTLDRDDFIIIGGGGLFMDYFTPFWEGFAPIADHVPFGIWGVGYCDHKFDVSVLPDVLLRPIVQKSRFCVVRDELTRRRFPEYPSVECVPCPSTIAVQPVGSSTAGLLHVVHAATLPPSTYDKTCSLLKRFAEETGRTYRETNNRIQVNEAALRATLGSYAQSDLVVSSRLHGCIIALAMGRKVLAISGDRKIEAFMDSMGLVDWVCDPDQIEKLSDLLQAFQDQPVPSERMQDARQNNQRVAEQVKAAVFEVSHS